MKFSGELEREVADRVAECDRRLRDPARLEAIQQTGLMGTPKDEAFDRLAKLAAHLLNAPLTIVSLVGDQKQFFKAAHGLPSPYDETREVPINDSICRYTLHSDPIIAHDTSTHELLKFHPTTSSWGIAAFVAIPMITPEGHVLGAFCAVDFKPRPWTDDDLFIMRELTNSVMTEIHLRRQVSQLKGERALRESFVMTLSHDLRNPLNVAKLAGDLLGDPQTTNEERPRFVKMISDNVDRADRMIQELLDASRLKVGEKLEADLRDGDLAEIVRAAVEDLRGIYGNRFEYKCEGAFPGPWDAGGLRRIIDNLAGNAIKYGDQKSPVVIAVEKVAGGTEVSVLNQGTPIAPADLENIFELFQRSDSALRGQQHGWGIGLTVVRSLAASMNGTLRVQSRAEDGTKFTIFFPS